MEQFLDFNYKARYFKLGSLSKDTKHLLFVLHGYGQLGKYFIRKFKVLENHGICIIAPEGLNRFYLEGFDGKVGATWMTKEDRETDIENYINYLDRIYDRLKYGDIKISILGFSQGAATASRWVTAKKVNFDSLILWAGIFPPDLNIDDSSAVLKNKEITYVYGTEDEFITQKRLKEMQDISKRLNVFPEIKTFKGGHEIKEEILIDIFLNNGG